MLELLPLAFHHTTPAYDFLTINFQNLASGAIHYFQTNLENISTIVNNVPQVGSSTLSSTSTFTWGALNKASAVIPVAGTLLTIATIPRDPNEALGKIVTGKMEDEFSEFYYSIVFYWDALKLRISGFKKTITLRKEKVKNWIKYG